MSFFDKEAASTSQSSLALSDDAFDDSSSQTSCTASRYRLLSSREESVDLSQSSIVIPSQLRRLPSNQRHIIWSLDTHALFVSWWIETPWGKHDPVVCKGTIKIKWDRRHQSEVWGSFDQIAHHRTGEPALSCKLCGQILKHPTLKNTGTSNLLGHLQQSKCRNLKRPQSNDNLRELLLKRQKSATQINLPPFSQSAWEEYLLTGLLAINASFASIDDPAFRMTYQILRPDLFIPHRDTLRKQLKIRYNEVRQQIKEALVGDQKISLSLDVWSSPNHHAFLGVVGYFVTHQWELKSFLLGFEPLSGRHTGSNLAKHLLNLLSYYAIEDRILALTTDNASNNTTMRTELRDKLLHELGLEWDPIIGTIPCMAHVIQLVVGELIKHLSVSPTNDKINESFHEDDIDALLDPYDNTIETSTYSNVIKKIRLISIAIFASPQRTESFLRLQNSNPRVIKQDCKTRWSSTIDMLSRAYSLRLFVAEWVRQESEVSTKFSKLQVSQSEWNHVLYMIAILRPFKRWTVALSKTKSVVIHQAWMVYNNLFDHLDDFRDKFLTATQSGVIFQNAIDAACRKLKEYYSRTDDKRGYIYNMACILDPSNKLTLYKQPDWKSYLNSYKSQFRDYYDTHYKPTSTSSPQLASIQAPLDDFNRMALQYRQKAQAAQPLKDEVRAYLESPVLPLMNPLDNWRHIQTEYPNLARMARDIYSVSMAEVEAERLFSIARRVCRWDRATLDASTIQMIMVVKLYDPELVATDIKEDAEQSSPEDDVVETEADQLVSDKAYDLPTMKSAEHVRRFPELKPQITGRLQEEDDVYS